MRITLEFSGGMELLFGGQKSIETDIPEASSSGKLTVAETLMWARDHLLTERPELFMQGSGVRPGVLVLINDVDWELCGHLDGEVGEGDRLTFISTLHGG